MNDVEIMIIEKEAQIRLLNALITQLCSCECEATYLESTKKQFENELRNLKNNS